MDKRHLRLAKLQGKKLGMLYIDSYNGDGTWKCICDCGNVVNKKTANIVRSSNPNCGCYRNCKGNTKHNLCKTRLYAILEKMKGRCYTKTDYAYQWYGAKGICICDEWLGEDGFMNFYNWSMQHGYNDKLSIDRIDTNGDYSPDNCRWTTMVVQQNNRSNNHTLTYNNETHTIAEWAKIYEMPYDRLHSRITKGWSIEKALLTPKMKNQFK